MASKRQVAAVSAGNARPPPTGGARPLALDEAAARLGTVLTPEVRAAARRLPLRFPADYLELADPADPADPIRAIGWPAPEELADDPGALPDPVGDLARRDGALVVRKYPDRALLLLTSRCHFYCRFCFRAGHGADPGLDEIERAVAALAHDAALREVILSGGDPLTLDDAFLGAVLALLHGVPQLTGLRLHTRAPVHDPARVTDALCATLAQHTPRPLRVVVHVTHPRELSPGVDAALQRLAGHGFALLDQTVLLRGVNDDVRVLHALYRGLAARGVAPHHLHHPDRIAGTARFRMSIPRGLALYTELCALLPPGERPRYVLDLPDGSGKVDVASLEPCGPRTWRAVHPDGRTSEYVDIEDCRPTP